MTSFKRSEVGPHLFSILREHVEDGIDIKAASTMTGDLSLDSLSVMEILAEVEDRFGVRMPDETLPELRTVADVQAALERHLAARGKLSE